MASAHMGRVMDIKHGGISAMLVGWSKMGSERACLKGGTCDQTAIQRKGGKLSQEVGLVNAKALRQVIAWCV